MGAVGFEPTKAEPSDLQSDPFVHFGTRPNVRLCRNILLLRRGGANSISGVAKLATALDQDA